jgi:hypothetical protein
MPHPRDRRQRPLQVLLQLPLTLVWRSPSAAVLVVAVARTLREMMHGVHKHMATAGMEGTGELQRAQQRRGPGRRPRQMSGEGCCGCPSVDFPS